jgi:hypothetical protein
MEENPDNIERDGGDNALLDLLVMASPAIHPLTAVEFDVVTQRKSGALLFYS